MPSRPRERSTCSKLSDVVIIAILYGTSLVLEWDSSIHPHTQYIPGLNDPNSINYNFEYPMQDSTVPTPVMFAICSLTWLFLLVAHCAAFWKYDPSFTLSTWAKYFYLFSRITMFSFSTTSLITDIIKKSVGSPRPFFNEAYLKYNDGEIDRREYNNARQSFVSGHASEAWSVALLLSIYLYQSYSYSMKCYVMNRKLATFSCNNPHSYFFSNLWYKLADVPLISISLIFIPTYFALYVSLTRLTDYKHHPSDVTSGALLGSCIAYLTYLIYYDELYLRFNLMEITSNKTEDVQNTRDKPTQESS